MYDIKQLSQEITLFLFYNTERQFSVQDIVSIVGLIISIIATIVIPLVIFKLNEKNQKLQALYQKKYEFWLDFSKSFFIMQKALSFLLKSSNLNFGVIYNCSKQDVIDNLKKLLKNWDKFYDLANGNEKIYLEPAGINILILQTLMSALSKKLNDEQFIIESNDFSVISKDSMSNLVTDAKLLLENNIKRLGNKQLEQNYINALNYYIKIDKEHSSPILDAKLSYEEKLKIIDNISNEAFLDIVYRNFDDISDKILNLTLPNRDSCLSFFKNVKLFHLFWVNIIQKIFSVKNNNTHKILTILWFKFKFRRKHL